MSNATHTNGRRIIAGAVLVSTLTLAGTANAADLTISINDIRKDSGKVMLNLLRNADQMAGKEASEASFMLAPNTAGVSFTLHNLEPGTYGVQVMHDENDNGELDANMLGIPKEPWAFSNNAAGKFGPPKWDSVQFSIGTEAVTQTISLNH